MLVADSSRLAAVVAAIRGAALVAFDIEFDTQGRLIPALCLVQVACAGRDFDAAAVPDDSIYLVDPMAIDAAPVVAALQAHPRVVAHAPRQDLWVLAAKLGARVPGLVDTQLMAAFAGLGDQLGLGSLVKELVGPTLDKDQQWTAWAKRPLSDRQLAYAADDVRYLPRVFAELERRIGADRLGWVRDETAAIARDAEAAADPDPDDAWRDLGGARGLGERELGALAAIAKWRVETAVARDRPYGWILPDKLLFELARALPRDAGAVLAVHGLPTPAREAAAELADRIANAPPIPRELARGMSPRAQRWADVLLAIANVVADGAGVAPRLLATRSDAEAFARAYDSGGDAAIRALSASTTWRRDVLLPAWHGWLSGKLVVAADPKSPHGIALAEIAPAPKKSPVKATAKPKPKAKPKAKAK